MSIEQTSYNDINKDTASKSRKSSDSFKIDENSEDSFQDYLNNENSSDENFDNTDNSSLENSFECNDTKISDIKKHEVIKDKLNKTLFNTSETNTGTSNSKKNFFKVGIENINIMDSHKKDIGSNTNTTSSLNNVSYKENSIIGESLSKRVTKTQLDTIKNKSNKKLKTNDKNLNQDIQFNNTTQINYLNSINKTEFTTLSNPSKAKIKKYSLKEKVKKHNPKCELITKKTTKKNNSNSKNNDNSTEILKNKEVTIGSNGKDNSNAFYGKSSSTNQIFLSSISSSTSSENYSPTSSSVSTTNSISSQLAHHDLSHRQQEFQYFHLNQHYPSNHQQHQQLQFSHNIYNIASTPYSSVNSCSSSNTYATVPELFELMQPSKMHDYAFTASSSHHLGTSSYYENQHNYINSSKSCQNYTSNIKSVNSSNILLNSSYNSSSDINQYPYNLARTSTSSSPLTVSPLSNDSSNTSPINNSKSNNLNKFNQDIIGICTHKFSIKENESDNSTTTSSNNVGTLNNSKKDPYKNNNSLPNAPMVHESSHNTHILCSTSLQNNKLNSSDFLIKNKMQNLSELSNENKMTLGDNFDDIGNILISNNPIRNSTSNFNDSRSNASGITVKSAVSGMKNATKINKNSHKSHTFEVNSENNDLPGSNEIGKIGAKTDKSNSWSSNSICESFNEKLDSLTKQNSNNNLSSSDNDISKRHHSSYQNYSSNDIDTSTKNDNQKINNKNIVGRNEKSKSQNSSLNRTNDVSADFTSEKTSLEAFQQLNCNLQFYHTNTPNQSYLATSLDLNDARQQMNHVNINNSMSEKNEISVRHPISQIYNYEQNCQFIQNRLHLNGFNEHKHNFSSNIVNMTDEINNSIIYENNNNITSQNSNNNRLNTNYVLNDTSDAINMNGCYEYHQKSCQNVVSHGFVVIN